MIAALFVETGGPYFGLPDVDPWDVARDARKYDGPHPVVAHPPCQRWGRYWFGGPSVKVRRQLGDDDGCFESALGSVRRFGGVLEHPAATHAFVRFGIMRPPSAGWSEAGDGLGWVCSVEQGNYGHKARKATWLYAVRTSRPELRWGASVAKVRLDEGFHSSAERKAARAMGRAPVKRLTETERLHTPVEFRDLLIWLAAGATP